MSSFLSLKHYLKKIPEDIIREHIIPYTYTPQDPDLCQDIQTFHKIKRHLTNIYRMYYQNNYEPYKWLAYDITRFLNNDRGTIYGFNPFFCRFISRLFMYRDKSYIELHEILSAREFMYSIPDQRNIFVKLALLLPCERERLVVFIETKTRHKTMFY
jgi:hypothetical protein